IRVQLREQHTGGITAVVVLPAALLADGPPAVTGLGDIPPVPGAVTGPRIHLPGSVAEAGSLPLPGSRHRAGGAHAAGPSGPVPLAPMPTPSPASVPVHPADLLPPAPVADLSAPPVPGDLLRGMGMQGSGPQGEVPGSLPGEAPGGMPGGLPGGIGAGTVSGAPVPAPLGR
ncbi:hypothetical protein K6I34_000321, partial [Streptomyces sp. UNOC14_S4]|nr:hypothetical protein [Streptomyces sp. UNOC14_S4]